MSGPVYVTALYAALLGVLFLLLGTRALLIRRRLDIAVGDGGNRTLLRAIRAHANFAEYVPLSLLLMLFAEIQGAGAADMHGMGLALLIGRLSHAIGVSREPENGWFRIVGMALTFVAIVAPCQFLLVGYVKLLFG